MTDISNLACVDPAAKMGTGVRIGPFCVVGPDVTIGEGCELLNHVTIQGVTRIGAHNIFYPHSVIGVAPQDLKYKGAPTETIIGYGNVFRENCTVHRGTELGGGKTVIGNNNLFMVACHVAHDCTLKVKIIVGIESLLGGHVTIEEGVVVEALVGVHQFVTLGKYSYIGGTTPVHRDVPPYMKFSGDPNAVRGVNEEGLRRNNFSEEEVEQLKLAYRALYRSYTISASLEELEQQEGLNGHVRYLCEFIRRSMESRFGRYQEILRRDKPQDRRRDIPVEVKTKNRRKEERQ